MMTQNPNESAAWLQFFIGLHPDKPLEELQELALKAQQASLKNWKKMQEFDPESDNTITTTATAVTQNQQLALETDIDKKDYYIFFKRDMLMTQDQKDIDAALKEDDEKLRCCICGNKFPNLKNHLKKVHHVSAEDYNRVCGYSVDTDLRSKKLIDSTKERTKKALASRKSKATEKPKADSDAKK